MSDQNAPPKSDTDEALTRMAAYGKKERAKSGWGPLVLILVLAIPLAAVGWLAWQQLELREEVVVLRADNAAFRATSEAVRADYAALQQSSASSSEQLAQVEQSHQELAADLRKQLDSELQQILQQELAADQGAAAAQAQRLAQIERALAGLDAKYLEIRVQARETETGGTPLAEAEALLRFAQQRLALARDTSTAAALMLAADELLRTVNDPGVLAVREMLTREIALLRAAPAVDVAGLFAQLGAQSARVDSFAVAVEGSVQDFSVSPAPTSEDTGADASWWTGVKQAVGEYFVVSQNTSEVVPQLDASEQFQLRALVQLKIEQARLALLQGDSQIYQSALDGALQTARRWLRGAGLDEFLASLELLRDTPIVADIPRTGEALAALRALTGMSIAPPAGETANAANAAAKTRPPAASESAL